MTTNEKIAALRAAMTAAGADIYYVPSSDEHMSEYLPDHWKSRAWLSGFSGSAGTLVVTRTESALWTDGRYFIQAAHQLEGSEIQLMRMSQPGVPTVSAYLADKLPAGGVLALDGAVTGVASVEEFTAACAEKNITVKDIDLVTPLWTEGREPIPATECYVLDEQYAGKSVVEKLTEVRAELAKQHASAMLESSLDAVAWLLNIRAADIAYNPFALAYCFVTASRAVLFINTARVSNDVVSYLLRAGVELKEYDEVVSFLAAYNEKENLLMVKSATSYACAKAIEGNSAFTVKAGTDPVQQLKGVKNATELACLKNSHAKDGVAMIRFQMKLEKAMAAGEKVTEMDVDTWLRDLRAAQPLNKGESFDTIAAYGANAAMMHYAPKPDTCATLQPKGYLLVDSGAQYLDGTTDITRTYALGALTDNEKKYYTLVLKSHIDLAKCIFMQGCTGGNIDIIARSAVWQHGIDYRCGTGHGVGFLGGVHEGPQNLRITNNVKFAPGMTITDEPGIYEEGEVGIRIENELMCVEKMTTEYGVFLGFEAFTYVPIDTTPVLPELLSDEELAWLNEYHKTVYNTLCPLLSDEEKTWLASKTAPVQR